MSKTTKLTIEEFLSIYTGFLIGKSFDVVISGLEKVYDEKGITTIETVSCHKKFKQYINTNRKDLVLAVDKLDKMYARKTTEDKVDEQINACVEKFKEIIGSDHVEVAVFTAENEMAM